MELFTDDLAQSPKDEVCASSKEYVGVMHALLNVRLESGCNGRINGTGDIISISEELVEDI